MNKSAKVRVNIRGVDYTIVSDDNEEYILSIGNEIDKKLTQMIESNSKISTTTAAVLCALSYCDESRKSGENADNLRSQVKDYLEDSSRSRVEAEDARREIDRLKRELQTLRARLAELDER
ncbi:MAG: cell division protein ZapA [Oscillospiraceae bacterium]|jgi:cell division protein ZapA (FtsZ GTPase activity inhibitor)|nr:cell division protein ZapA [Oscillospiraceae bacterium]